MSTCTNRQLTAEKSCARNEAKGMVVRSVSQTIRESSGDIWLYGTIVFVLHSRVLVTLLRSVSRRKTAPAETPYNNHAPPPTMEWNARLTLATLKAPKATTHHRIYYDSCLNLGKYPTSPRFNLEIECPPATSPDFDERT